MNSPRMSMSDNEQRTVMADAAPVLIWMAIENKSCTTFNEGWLAFTGRTTDEELGLGWTLGVHPDDLERCLNLYNVAFAKRIKYRMSYRMKRFDGVYCLLLETGVPRFNNKSDFEGFVGSCVDIDEIYDLSTDNTPEITGQPFPDRLRQVYDTGKSYGEEEPVFRYNGIHGPVIKYVSYYYDPLLNADGEVCGMIVSAEDITKRVMARQLLEKSYSDTKILNEALRIANEEVIAVNEEMKATNDELIQAQINLQYKIAELAASESRFRFLIHRAPVAIGLLHEREMLVESANEMMFKLWGKTSSIIGKPLSLALPEIRDQGFLEILDEVHMTGEPYHGNEVPAIVEHEGGLQISYFNFVYQPIKNVWGKISDVIVVAVEVTEQVHAREAVERAEEQMRFSIEAAELGTYYINAEDRILVASPRLKEFFGFDPDEEMPYESAINQIHPDYRQDVSDRVEACFKIGVRFDMEYPVVGYHDGRIRWVRGIGAIQRDTDGKIYFTGVLNDITESRQDEQRKNDFIAMVSHELKTPLTSLTGIVQLLERKLKGMEDSFVSSALDKAQKQVRKMTVMINGFLNVSRLESGKIQLNKHGFDLMQLIKEAVEDSELVSSEHDFVLPQGPVIPIYADRDKIGSVISNLLSNAVKYSPNGKLIELDVVLSEDMVTLRIKDQGMGIKQQDISQLFERYYRVESDHTQNISGFGIGLYLSSEIINHHGGEIGVQSEPGKGSAFWFSLPLSSDQP